MISNNTKFFKFDNIVQSFDCVSRILLSEYLINEKAVVLCKKISSYDRIISNIFKKYNISFNKSYCVSIHDTKIYLLITSLINFIRYGLKQEYIVNFLSLYPVGFENEKIWEFKAYCSIYDISDFESEFVLLPVRKLKNKDINLNAIESLNQTRSKITKFFSNLMKNFQKSGICKTILDFLSEEEYYSYEYYDTFATFLHKFKDISLSIEDFEEKLSEHVHNISGKLSKEARVYLMENLDFDDLSRKIGFLIIEDKDKISDYESDLPNFESKYFIFLNDEYLQMRENNVMSISDIPCCDLKFVSTLENFSYFSEPYRIQIDEIDIAISKIENYYRCSLFYFFNCILDINNNKKFTFDSSEYGSLVHHTFEQYFKLYNGSKIEDSVHEIVQEYMNSMFKLVYSSSKIKYMVEKYSKNLVFVINKMIKELEKDRFSPEYFEVKFCQTLKTYSGKSVVLKGKIDRVDVDQERKEMRTVDYKTKNKKFSISNVVHGLNIQPIVYLRFFPEQSLRKTGAFYFCTKRPIINGDDVDLNSMNLDKKINESISLQGISLDNMQFMESKGPRNDSFSYEDFETIMKYSEFLVKQMAEDVISGNVYKNPRLFLGGVVQCENCIYKYICERKNMRYIKSIRYKNAVDAIKDMKNKMNCLES